jgi:hypothetical protein
VINRRSLAFGISRAEKMPPANKNKTPKRQTINVVAQKSTTHEELVAHL